MDTGVIAYSAQKNLFDRLEFVSNNAANVNTDGFKADLALYLKNNKVINGKPSPVPALKSAVDLQPGTLKATGRQLDVAINGKGFFQVETPLGPRFTRNGSFFINTEGSLVTKEGYSVIGEGGPVTLDPNDYEIKIGENGDIVSVKPTGNEIRGTIGVFKFENTSNLSKVGNSLFKTDDTPESAEYVTDFRVAQGMLEDSNVNQVDQMTEMVEISRAVQSLAKIIQDQNQLERSAFQRIAGK